MYNARIDDTRRIRVQRSSDVLKSACPRILYYHLFKKRAAHIRFFFLLRYSYKCFSRIHYYYYVHIINYVRPDGMRYIIRVYIILCTIAIYGIVKNRLEEKSIA